MCVPVLADIASIIGLILTLCTFIFALFIQNKVSKLQKSNQFEKYILSQLKVINDSQSELNRLMPDIESNERSIKEILAKYLAIFEDLNEKLYEREAKIKTKKIIQKIQKFKNCRFLNILPENNFITRILPPKHVDPNQMHSLYILINENYNRIAQIRLNRKALII